MGRTATPGAMTQRGIPMTIEILRRWCGRSVRIVAGSCGSLVLFLLSDAWPGVNLDHARAVAWRIFRWVRR